MRDIALPLGVFILLLLLASGPALSLAGRFSDVDADTYATYTVDAFGDTFVQARCHDGDRVVGGGYWASRPPTFSAPNGDAWAVYLEPTGKPERDWIRVRAVCLVVD